MSGVGDPSSEAAQVVWRGSSGSLKESDRVWVHVTTRQVAQTELVWQCGDEPLREKVPLAWWRCFCAVTMAHPCPLVTPLKWVFHHEWGFLAVEMQASVTMRQSILWWQQSFRVRWGSHAKRVHLHSVTKSRGKNPTDTHIHTLSLSLCWDGSCDADSVDWIAGQDFAKWLRNIICESSSLCSFQSCFIHQPVTPSWKTWFSVIFQLLVPRQSYFPLVTDKVQRHFLKYVDPDSHGEMWLEYNGQPLRWYSKAQKQSQILWKIDCHWVNKVDTWTMWGRSLVQQISKCERSQFDCNRQGLPEEGFM